MEKMTIGVVIGFRAGAPFRARRGTSNPPRLPARESRSAKRVVTRPTTIACRPIAPRRNGRPTRAVRLDTHGGIEPSWPSRRIGQISSRALLCACRRKRRPEGRRSEMGATGSRPRQLTRAVGLRGRRPDVPGGRPATAASRIIRPPTVGRLRPKLDGGSHAPVTGRGPCASSIPSFSRAFRVGTSSGSGSPQD